MGKEFDNEVIHKVCKALGVEHIVTAAYNPRTNGKGERLGRTLINALRKHCENNPDTWHKWIPFVLMAYRSLVNSTT